MTSTACLCERELSFLHRLKFFITGERGILSLPFFGIVESRLGTGLKVSRSGIGIKKYPAGIVLERPRKNLAGALMSALRDEGKAPKANLKKPLRPVAR